VIKAIIFDCFGVLIGKGFENTYRMAGGNPTRDRSFIEKTLGQANLGLISDDDFRVAMARQLGIDPEHWSQATQGAERLNVELLDYITQLHVIYKTAMLSNANNGVPDRIIGETWLQKNFDEIVISAEVGMVKPDERIYQLVADRLGVIPNECLYIDDHKNLLVPASKLGMSVLAYEDFDQLKRDITKQLKLMS
jgi:putative hydrolase of the HAD superfamily